MSLRISAKVKAKLQKKHNVTEEEIIECFQSCENGYLLDEREDNQTDPPTQWFISETDYGRLLKVVFIMHYEDRVVEIKTAYEPNNDEINLYNKIAK